MTTNPPVHLLGATNVGKGFMTYLLELFMKLQHKIQVGIVGVGDEVRDRFLNDTAFKLAYEALVANGQLVPDSQIIPMFDRKLGTVSDAKLVVTDGFLRNARQVEHAEHTDLLDSGSACIIMHASRNTCYGRLLHRMEKRPNGKRVDENRKTFDYRYDFHQNSIPQVQAALIRTGTRVLHVDANGDLEKDVFPQVQTFAECVLFRHFQQEQRDFMHEAFVKHMMIHQGQQASMTDYYSPAASMRV